MHGPWIKRYSNDISKHIRSRNVNRTLSFFSFDHILIFSFYFCARNNDQKMNSSNTNCSLRLRHLLAHSIDLSTCEKTRHYPRMVDYARDMTSGKDYSFVVVFLSTILIQDDTFDNSLLFFSVSIPENECL